MGLTKEEEAQKAIEKGIASGIKDATDSYKFNCDAHMRHPDYLRAYNAGFTHGIKAQEEIKREIDEAKVAEQAERDLNRQAKKAQREELRNREKGRDYKIQADETFQAAAAATRGKIVNDR